MTPASKLDVRKRIRRTAPVVPASDNAGQLLVQTLLAKPLPEEFVPWVEEYEQLGHRPRFLWHWCFEGAAVTTLPCVDAELRRENLVTKVLEIMWVVLLDDVADRRRDDSFLEVLLDLCDGGAAVSLHTLARDDRATAEFIVRLLHTLEARPHAYPRHKEFHLLARFDRRQLVNALRYSALVNSDLRLLNLTEHDLYLSHNMHMMMFGTLDLMCSPSFQSDELALTRELVWHMQCMGRIGNLLSTWERELYEGDFSSGVFAWAVRHGVIPADGLQALDRGVVRERIRQSDGEAFFLDRWADHRRAIESMMSDIRSFDVGILLEGLDRFLRLHLDSRGRK